MPYATDKRLSVWFIAGIVLFLSAIVLELKSRVEKRRRRQAGASASRPEGTNQLKGDIVKIQPRGGERESTFEPVRCDKT